jgi:hypothetical protein
VARRGISTRPARLVSDRHFRPAGRSAVVVDLDHCGEISIRPIAGA